MITLFIIDPQNDFMDQTIRPDGSIYNGSLGVPGARSDMDRLSSWIRQNSNSISHIYVSLDWHHRHDISHPSWFVNSKQENPAPYTIIHLEDVLNGTWACSKPEDYEVTVQYLRDLQGQGRPHRIWPYHCIQNDFGAQIDSALNHSLVEWQNQHNTSVEYIFKGSDPFTEHFSAFKACVPNQNPQTQFNDGILINAVASKSEQFIFCGEALTHCVFDSIIDFKQGLSKLNVNTPVSIFLDATSPVPGFEVEPILERLSAEGIIFQKTSDDLSFKANLSKFF